MPGDRAAWQLDLAIPQAKLQIDRKFAVVLLPAKTLVFPSGIVGECVPPVDRADQFLEVIHGVTGGVKPADDCANAGPGNGVDRYPLALQLAQHADVRRAAGTAAAEHETDTGPIRRVCVGQAQRRVGRLSGCRLG